MAQSFLNQTGLPLGLRNNNPGNIRPGDSWVGMIGSNQGFVVFSDISWGIRAMATDLGNDMRKGLDTVRKLITEYAPPAENDTEAYIRSVIRDMKVFDNQILKRDLLTLQSLMRAIMNVELGRSYSALVKDADIKEGLSKMNPTLLSAFGISAAAGGSASIIIIVIAIGLVLFNLKK